MVLRGSWILHLGVAATAEVVFKWGLFSPLDCTGVA